MMIQGQHIVFRYPKSSTDTLEDFSFSLEQGGILAILGESGCGKTTALRVLAGLERPTQGLLSIQGRVVFSKDIFVPPERRGIGMVFQDYALFPHMTVVKNIQYGLRSLSPAEREERTQEMLHLVHLTEHGNKYPYELSGGQQQRVAIARSLACRPSILLLDEPFSNLDAGLQGKIREEIKEILTCAQITSIFVTHNLEDARALATQVIWMEQGAIVKQGPPDLLE